MSCKSFFSRFFNFVISDFGIMESEIRNDRINHATKVVSTHMKLQNPHYAQLEVMMKVIPGPSVSLPTDMFRIMEGNARILVIEWNAQGEFHYFHKCDIEINCRTHLLPII